jgi:hypothetical protein
MDELLSTALSMHRKIEFIRKASNVSVLYGRLNQSRITHVSRHFSDRQRFTTLLVLTMLSLSLSSDVFLIGR